MVQELDFLLFTSSPSAVKSGVGGASCRVGTVGFLLVLAVLVLVSQGPARGSGALRLTHNTTAVTGRLSAEKTGFGNNSKQTE